MDLSIIIVNWNSSQYLEKCLKSIKENPCQFLFEIIVVDNASFDGCVPVVEKYSRMATLIQSEKNLGFARANNLGFRHSKGRALLFLNPDTVILGDALNKMHNVLLSTPSIGGLGCKVLNTDGSRQTSCIQAFPTIINQMLDTNCVRNLFPRSRLWGMRSLFEDVDHPQEVEAIAGSCLMVRREAFEDAGGFNEEYFMYAEDIDLCYRLHQKGYKNYYVGLASIVHHGGGSTKNANSNSFSAVIKLDSIKKYFLKHHGYYQSVLYLFVMQMVSFARITLLVAYYPVTFLSKSRERHLTNSIHKWKSVFLWSLGRDEWVRELYEERT